MALCSAQWPGSRAAAASRPPVPVRSKWPQDGGPTYAQSRRSRRPHEQHRRWGDPRPCSRGCAKGWSNGSLDHIPDPAWGRAGNRHEHWLSSLIQILLRRQEPTHLDSLLKRGLGHGAGFWESPERRPRPSSLCRSSRVDGLIQIIEALRIGADIAVHNHLDRALLPRLGGCLRSISREGQQLGIATYSQRHRPAAADSRRRHAPPDPPIPSALRWRRRRPIHPRDEARREPPPGWSAQGSGLHRLRLTEPRKRWRPGRDSRSARRLASEGRRSLPLHELMPSFSMIFQGFGLWRKEYRLRTVFSKRTERGSGR